MSRALRKIENVKINEVKDNGSVLNILSKNIEEISFKTKTFFKQFNINFSCIVSSPSCQNNTEHKQGYETVGNLKVINDTA